MITRVMRPVLRIAFCALLPLRKRHWKAEIAAIWFVRSLGICRRKPRACGSRIFDRIRDSHSRFERNLRSSSRYIDHTIIIYIMMIDEIDQEIRPSTYYLLTFVRRYPYVLIIITYHMILFFLAYYHIISYYYY